MRGSVPGSVRATPTFVRRCALTLITILAITGTLSACGRYGSPVRVVPVEVEAEVEVEVEVEAGAEDPQTKARAADESSDRKAEDDRTE